MAAFLYDLFRHSTTEPTNSCVCVQSIYTLLDLIIDGAKNETRSELINVVNSSSTTGIDSDDDANFHSTSVVFVDKETRLSSNFVSIITRKNCTVEKVPFRVHPESAIHRINEVVKNRTNGKIATILDRSNVTDETNLILVNAVHFKASWKEVFDPIETDPDHFHSLDGNLLADFMYQKSTFKYNEIPDCKILEMSYENDKYSMLFFLPKYTETLDFLVRNITPEFVARNRANTIRQKVKVYIPKFVFSLSMDFRQILMSMGIKNLFTCADLSGMTDEAVSVTSLMQKVYIEVNETGTEACAVSAATMFTCVIGDIETIPVFKADRPFLFILLRSDQPLFIGKLMKPDPSQKTTKPREELSKMKAKPKRKCDIS